MESLKKKKKKKEKHIICCVQFMLLASRGYEPIAGPSDPNAPPPVDKPEDEVAPVFTASGMINDDV